MVMEQADIAAIIRELHQAHAEALSGYDMEMEALERTFAMLPAPEEWRVSVAMPIVYLLAAGDTLLTIAIDHDVSDPGVTLSSRPLNGHGLVISLRWGQRRTEDATVYRRTHWTFRYVDQKAAELEDWQRIEGRVTLAPAEELDRNERFARALLSRALSTAEGGHHTPLSALPA
jgi:hypothetical protein